MEYLLKVSDAAQRHLAVLSLKDSDVAKTAIDFVFDIIGTNDPESLVSKGILPEGQVGELKSLQQVIFDKDADGLFIREDVNFKANGNDLNPDAPIGKAFNTAQKEDIEYKRCDLVVYGGSISEDVGNADSQGAADGQRVSIEELANLLFLHQLAIGKHVDVTKEIPELTGVISRAEKSGFIEIDVKSAGYKLTEKGKRRHDSYVEEAQNLIRKYDIYCDVDLDSSGNVHFDTGLGQDLRVPVFEKEGVDPFRARFLLGLNDGEWDQLQNWEELLEDHKWYDEVFRPIEVAPSIDDIGEAKLEHIIDRAKAKLRSTSY
ncbi:MAG: hypothetical protein K2X77_28305 [Candidatus Obscuribacterales bacterium]|jgi:hypothetical protein|nr:hypothetical protein [Candidatus Obscuribacterales bacterium]